MRYTTKIELPVEKSKAGSYVLSYDALQQMLRHLGEQGNIVSIEWENGNCVATVDVFSPVTLDPEVSSLELFVRDIVNQNSGKIDRLFLL